MAAVAYDAWQNCGQEVWPGSLPSPACVVPKSPFIAINIAQPSPTNIVEVDSIVSDKTSAKDDQCETGTCCAWKFALALLLLRLCIGWHFFSEGTKKLTYDQGRQEWQLNVPTEMVFRSATGPFADLMKDQLPGFYDWENLLAVPAQSQPLDSEALAQRDAWQRDYASRRSRAKKENQPEPIEFPESAPYKAWGEKIVEGMRERLEKFNNLDGISEAQGAEAADVFVARHQQLADFLATEAEAIEEYQHELWRQQQLETQPGTDDIPFRQKRLAAKRSETGGLGARLVSEVRGIERGFHNDLRSVLTAEQRADDALADQVEVTLTDPKSRRLHWLNISVTCLIIGVGICLLLGLFTRLGCAGRHVVLVHGNGHTIALGARGRHEIFLLSIGRVHGPAGFVGQRPLAFAESRRTATRYEQQVLRSEKVSETWISPPKKKQSAKKISTRPSAPRVATFC